MLEKSPDCVAESYSTFDQDHPIALQQFCTSEALEAAAEAKAVAAKTRATASEKSLLQQHTMQYAEDQAQLANALQAFAQQL